MLLTITEPCLNREFPRVEVKHCRARKIFEYLRGPTTWLVLPRNVWNDTVTLQTGRLNNSTKYLLHASMTTTSKKKKWNLLENCQKCGLKIFWNACTWRVLEDQIFMVSELTCTIDFEMDQSLWQTPESIDFIYSSHMWIQTVLLCG